MPILEIEYHPRALKDLRRVPFGDRDRIIQRLEAYATDPDNPRHSVVALVGQKPTARLRVGDWRVIFDRLENRIEIRSVRHRREAYR
jgi:mRNA interferase RelE/StbE